MSLCDAPENIKGGNWASDLKAQTIPHLHFSVFHCVSFTCLFRCECPPGFRGVNCSEAYADCRTLKCDNGGTCQQGKHYQYQCECPPRASGEFCEHLPMVHLPIHDSPCQLECENGGQCYQDNETSTSVCRCLPGYSGERCETVVSMSFQQRDAFIQIEAPDMQNEVIFTIEFATTSESGILLYHGYVDHVAAELFRGRIRVSYDVGNFPVATMFSADKLNDGSFHTLQILVHQKNISMSIDGGKWKTETNEGEYSHLAVQMPMFIAGLPAREKETAVQQWHLRNGSSFQGLL